MTTHTDHTPAIARMNDRFEARRLTSLSGEVEIPDPSRLVHLQLRRFAGCPICNLHLRSFALRYDELVDAGVVEVAVFHSSAAALRKANADLPFALVPDPERSLYRELGVGSSPRAMLDPRAWLAATRALTAGVAKNPSAGAGDGSFGLPGDFLIASDGRVLEQHRGKHADDQWSVDELLAHVHRHTGRG